MGFILALIVLIIAGSGVYAGKNDNRIARVDKFLRAANIDELPQRINILKGAMSFVAPRPPLTYHPRL